MSLKGGGVSPGSRFFIIVVRNPAFAVIKKAADLNLFNPFIVVILLLGFIDDGGDFSGIDGGEVRCVCNGISGGSSRGLHLDREEFILTLHKIHVLLNVGGIRSCFIASHMLCP